MYYSALLAGFLAALVGNVSANKTPEEFTTPSGDTPVYTVGESITFDWIFLTGEDIGVLLWQMSPEPSTSNSISLLSDSSSKEVTWKVSRDWLVDVDDDETAVAYLGMYISGETTLRFSSIPFNISAIADSSDDKSSSIVVESSTAVEETEAASTEEAKTRTVVNEVTVTGDAATEAATTEAATTEAASTIISTNSAGGATTIIITASGASAAGASASTSTSSASSTPSSEASSGSALSTGKIAGIAVGSIISAISALGGFGFLWRRKRRARKAKADLELKMQQQSNQTTQIHISQAAAPSPPAPPAAGHVAAGWHQDNKSPYPPTHTSSYAPTHSTPSPVYPHQQPQGYSATGSPIQQPGYPPVQPPAQWNNSPVQSQTGYAPPPQQWNQSPQQAPAELGSAPASQQAPAELGNPAEYRPNYGHGNSGAFEAP
ncbi:hypothetical protein G7Z17_g6786 [Cylindrodendrum hubeiense]|uniref:Uncharacterized protein n=1 Tax=Cylindrodendrum hubeiense TaxID=595255 RepID=A0A9P5HAA0_9HYPO|nr:hypothetical protein G7Z17_g6786 [Cylindrodendrum hubeiense]